MYEDFSKIKVGDRLIIETLGWKNYSYVTVTRLTKKWIVTENENRYEYKFDVSSGKEIGSKGFNSRYIRLVTKKIEDEIKKLDLISKVRAIGEKLTTKNLENLTITQIEAIHDFLTKNFTELLK